MQAWSPPKGSKITFRIGRLTDVPGQVLREGNPQRWGEAPHRAFCNEFGLKFERYGSETIPLHDPRWPAMLDWIADLTERGEGGLRSKAGGNGIWWMEAPEPRGTDKSAWFPLSTGPTEIRHPQRPPRGRHFVSRPAGKSTWGALYLASQEFKQAVEDAGLTGLGFLPLPNWDGWWQVWATEPLGRGIDHPLVDPQKLAARADPTQPILAPRRRGEAWAWIKYLRDDARIADPTIARLLALGDDYLCRITGPRRFIREHLPETDFAYSEWTYEEDEPLEWVGRRMRDICCNQRAREILIDAGVMERGHFRTPSLVTPEAEADAPILDVTIGHPLPLPVFTAEEAAEERERRLAPRPVRTSPSKSAPKTAEEILAALTARHEEGSATWKPLRDDAERLMEFRSAPLFAALPRSLTRLVDLLPVEVEVWSGDEDEEPEFEFELGTPQSPDWLDQHAPRDAAEAPSPDDIVFAGTGCGDWFAIRATDPKLPADAKVTWWDHETFAPKDEWPTVASFVEHLVSMSDREIESGHQDD
jgi:hypothetical protein